MRVEMGSSHPSHCERVAHSVHILHPLNLPFITARRTNFRDPGFDKHQDCLFGDSLPPTLPLFLLMNGKLRHQDRTEVFEERPVVKVAIFVLVCLFVFLLSIHLCFLRFSF